MTRRPTLSQRLLHGDRGTTLVELLVGMMVMAVFMTIFTGAVVAMARTTAKVEAVTTSAAQVDNAFLELDTLIRYAGAVTTAGRASNGTWYVELSRIDSETGAEVCTQLRTDVSGSQPRLQQRTWTAVSPTSWTSLSGWTAVASSLVNATAAVDSADQPFVNSRPSSAPTRQQQLTVTIVAGSPEATSSSTTRASVTFTALNSSTSDPNSSARCKQVARS